VADGVSDGEVDDGGKVRLCDPVRWATEVLALRSGASHARDNSVLDALSLKLRYRPKDMQLQSAGRRGRQDYDRAGSS
jgi:hypothetical protein